MEVACRVSTSSKLQIVMLFELNKITQSHLCAVQCWIKIFDIHFFPTQEASKCLHRCLHQGVIKMDKSHSTNKFSCDTCKKVFQTKSNLNRHKSVHTKNRSFPCPLCGKKFSQRGDVNRHQLVHKIEKTIVCEECGSFFSKPSDLKRHNRVHTKEKPYPCEVCGKFFADQSSCRRHERTHQKSISSNKEFPESN